MISKVCNINGEQAANEASPLTTTIFFIGMEISSVACFARVAVEMPNTDDHVEIPERQERGCWAKSRSIERISEFRRSFRRPHINAADRTCR